MLKQRLQTLSPKDCVVHDAFWDPYIRLVTEKVIPYQWEILNDRVPGAEPSGCIRNLRIAAGEEEGSFIGAVFQDTDVAKWLEAVSYSLSVRPNPELEALADETIALIGRAQCEDGYLNTYFTIQEPENRFQNLQEGHELYTAGHFVEAAVAYYQATGKDALLNIMRRCCDYIGGRFGREPGKLHGYPGHQEIELALVRLYRVTGERKYLELARYFIDERGKHPLFFDEQRKHLDHYIFPEMAEFDEKYFQVHERPVDQRDAVGHAVRAVYMYSAMADLAAEYQDKALYQACCALYDSIAERKLYLTGSIGAAAFGERFAGDYDLPNDTNYSETCASVGLAMFCRRMANLTGEAKYVDTMERCLYNTVLSGVSLSGTEFFYVNPLEVWPDSCENNSAKRHVKTERQKWFGVACCPPNLARTVVSLGQYAYSYESERINVDLYVSGSAKFLVGGITVELRQATRYPYEGTITIAVRPEKPAPFTIGLRIPGWCGGWCAYLDGNPVSPIVRNGYLELAQVWLDNVIELKMDMTPILYEANPKVRADIGRVAIGKGPLIYCLEEIDNGSNLQALSVSTGEALTEEYREDLLGGTLVIRAQGHRLVEDSGPLYHRAKEPDMEKATLTAIPYCLWNNRGVGEMAVWIRREFTCFS